MDVIRGLRDGNSWPVAGYTMLLHLCTVRVDHTGVKYRRSSAALMFSLAMTSWSNKDFETRTCFFFFARVVDLSLHPVSATDDPMYTIRG